MARITLSAKNARQLTVSGHLTGLADDQAYIRVTVTQRSTGAVAEGIAIASVTGSAQQWEVQAMTQSKAEFAEGPVTVVYMIVTSYQGDTTDANQWLAARDLIKEE